MTTLREAAQQALEALEKLVVGSEYEEAVEAERAIYALRAALAEPVQESSDMAEQLADALDSAQFYRRRCEAIQAWQSKMRDPERVIVCDILANGKTLDPAVAGDRYTVPRPAEPVQEPVAWRFQSAVGGWAYGSQPPLGSKYPAYPLYTAPPQRKPLTEEEIQELSQQHKFDLRMEKFVRIIERAHGIKE